MSDVYKFRVTVDLELATHESPRKVREYLKDEVEFFLRSRDVQHEPRVLDFHVRTKRLDDWATIGPQVALHIDAITCPHCGQQMTDVTVHQLPMTCPRPGCHKVIPLEGRVRP